MLKNSLSLNRIANIFYIILKHLQEYDTNKKKMLRNEKIAKLEKIVKIIDVCIDVLDRKSRLKGISSDFVAEAIAIKLKQKEDKNGSWIRYLNIFHWFDSSE